MYSKDLRTAATFMYLNKVRSCRKVGKYLNIGKSTVSRWLRCSPLVKKRIGFKKVNESINNIIHECIKINPLTSAFEINRVIKDKLSVTLSTSTISYNLRKLRYSKKTLTNVVNFNNLSQERHKFEKWFKEIDPHSVISIDETAFHLNMKPLKGYSKKGSRLYHKTHNKQYRGQKISLLLAITTKGILGYKLQNKNFNTSEYNTFIQNLHVENRLKYIIMDNASIHSKAQDILYTKNLKRIKMPPYSPCYNPIEQVFSAVKHKFRKNYELPIKERFMSCIDIISNLNLTSYYNNSWNTHYEHF